MIFVCHNRKLASANELYNVLPICKKRKKRNANADRQIFIRVRKQKI